MSETEKNADLKSIVINVKENGYTLEAHYGNYSHKTQEFIHPRLKECILDAQARLRLQAEAKETLETEKDVPF